LVTRHKGRRDGKCVTNSFTNAEDTSPVCPGTNIEMSSATVVHPGGHSSSDVVAVLSLPLPLLLEGASTRASAWTQPRQLEQTTRGAKTLEHKNKRKNRHVRKRSRHTLMMGSFPRSRTFATRTHLRSRRKAAAKRCDRTNQRIQARKKMSERPQRH